MLRFVAICSILALAGCAGSTSEPDQTSTPSVQAENYDLSKLSELEDDFPAGFVPFDSEVEKLQHVYVPSVGTVLSGSETYTADPPRCSVLLKPVDGVAGSDAIGIRADGAEERSIGVGAYVPVNIPAEIPASGCDRVKYAVPHDQYPTSGTVERIGAPTIDGATTLGLKITVDQFPDPEYFYAAIIDDRVYVNVQARLAPDYAAQPLLPDLLVKAVNAIRGQ